MGKITKIIEKIMEEEKLTLQQAFEKYPHLIEPQKEELWQEFSKDKLHESKKKDLLLD